MNQGIDRSLADDDWILFWGSDDQAPSETILEDVASRLKTYQETHSAPDLFVCSGAYYRHDPTHLDSQALIFSRETKFHFRHSYRRSLFFGSTPPHQATFFGPKAFRRVPGFSTSLKLAADLDYFLRLSKHSDVSVVVEDLEVVWLGDAGVSSQHNKRRLREVAMAYRNAFGFLCWFPFMLRYWQRLKSLH